jgi:hypothetical protein
MYTNQHVTLNTLLFTLILLSCIITGTRTVLQCAKFQFNCIGCGRLVWVNHHHCL